MIAWGRPCRRLVGPVLLIGAAMLCVGLAGCSTAFQIGAAPSPAQVGRLVVGSSSQAEVLQALGEPRGRGMARLAGVERPRVILFYDAYRGEGQRIDMTFLVVFLDGERYDGYLWMSSSQLLEKVE
jgi:hypothetical protein